MLKHKDWKENRKYTNKNNQDSFWVNWDEFKKYFDKVYVSHYDENLDHEFMKFMLKDTNRFAINIQINKTTPVYIEVDQLDKLFSDATYKYSDVRMYVVQRLHLLLKTQRLL